MWSSYLLVCDSACKMHSMTIVLTEHRAEEEHCFFLHISPA
jgi:hypothetical protein